MHHVVKHEAQRMNRDETVHHADGLVIPVVAGMEGERKIHLFEQRISLHV